MAASDPTPYVTTPTGTLQGVAAFSWDGSAWQPSAGAGPDVATPAGVLRGVAPFSWDGAAWQPAGRAQPGVATPTGVLDGVAVYTWSGSAWTPAGGTATPATPTGALCGIAAFSWDGAAWQPAAQARPSVATPYGVLDGVAFFNWSGTTWAAGAAVPSGATLDLSFLSGALDPRITFTRASTAIYFDASGTMQTAAINAPRFDYDPVTHALRGLLIEEPRTNLLLNSAALGTQSVAVTAQAYTLSFYGTGTVTLSGAFAGSLVGTGAFPQRVSQTFTPAAGTLTCTVTGSVLNAQLEAGTFATSWTPTTAAAATRAGEVATMPTSSWFASSAGTFQAEFATVNIPPGGAQGGIIRPDDATDNNSILIYAVSGSGAISAYAAIATVAQINNTAGPIVNGMPQKVAMAYGGGLWRSAAAGVVQNGTGSTVPFPATRIILGSDYVDTVNWKLNGYMRRVRYWPRALSNAEMQSVTT